MIDGVGPRVGPVTCQAWKRASQHLYRFLSIAVVWNSVQPESQRYCAVHIVACTLGSEVLGCALIAPQGAVENIEVTPGPQGVQDLVGQQDGDFKPFLVCHS